MQEGTKVESPYSPAIFDVDDMARASEVILTPNDDQTTEERWLKETPYLLDLMEQEGVKPKRDDLVLDFGCGIGRMSQAMIERWDCRVIGVDISPSMQKFAVEYVNSSNFMVCSPPMLKYLAVQKGLRVEHAISIWAIQHVARPLDTIELIHFAMDVGASLFVVNEKKRLVPTKHAKWVDDGFDVLDALRSKFGTSGEPGILDPAVVTKVVSERTFWALCR